MGTKWQRTEIQIPEGYTRKEREAIGQEIVDAIRDRVQNKNTDKNGKPLAKYSQAYVDSLDFKNAGKSKSDVNFTQSGDTIAAMDVLEHSPGKIVVGWKEGSPENAIADGNIRGTFGHDETVGPKRDILGLPKSDLNRILQQFPLDSPDELDEKIAEYLISKEASRGE